MAGHVSPGQGAHVLGHNSPFYTISLSPQLAAASRPNQPRLLSHRRYPPNAL